MADATISINERGAYENTLGANTEYAIDIVPSSGLTSTIRIVVHSATAPVYASWATVTVKSKTAMMLTPNATLDLTIRGAATVQLHLISSAAASVSVTRA